MIYYDSMDLMEYSLKALIISLSIMVLGLSLGLFNPVFLVVAVVGIFGACISYIVFAIACILDEDRDKVVMTAGALMLVSISVILFFIAINIPCP